MTTRRTRPRPAGAPRRSLPPPATLVAAPGPRRFDLLDRRASFSSGFGVSGRPGPAQALFFFAAAAPVLARGGPAQWVFHVARRAALRARLRHASVDRVSLAGATM
eukprot:7188084-Lingulodinium_polyedra.AAC.1